MNRYLFFLLLLFAGFASCTKTETVDYEKDPENKILEYKISNATETLYGIVDDIDKTITVYLPYYLSIDFIVPQIKLQAGAKLIDKDGNDIDIKENLEPVALHTQGYQYTVKDINNQIRRYTLITKISPYKDALKLGYKLNRDNHGNTYTDTISTYDGFANSRITIYGNFESSSKNGTLTLIEKKNNKIIPNALKIIDVYRDNESHKMLVQVTADIDSGSYQINVAHQGRKATLPTLHLAYKKPVFERLGKVYAVDDIVTLNLSGANTSSGGGVNTGVKRLYTKLIKQHFIFPGAYYPNDFPDDLFGKIIELEIVSQTKTQLQFKFPNVPVGLYSTSMGTGGDIIQYTGFGFYFDFVSTAWGNDNLLSSIPYLIEVKAKN